VQLFQLRQQQYVQRHPSNASSLTNTTLSSALFDNSTTPLGGDARSASLADAVVRWTLAEIALRAPEHSQQDPSAQPVLIFEEDREAQLPSHFISACPHIDIVTAPGVCPTLVVSQEAAPAAGWPAARTLQLLALCDPQSRAGTGAVNEQRLLAAPQAPESVVTDLWVAPQSPAHTRALEAGDSTTSGARQLATSCRYVTVKSASTNFRMALTELQVYTADGTNVAMFKQTQQVGMKTWSLR
jgi:hypothetical protein